MRETDTYEFVGDLLRDLRLDKGKTQKEVANEIEGISAAAIGFAEVDKRPINPKNLEKFADYYEVELEILQKLENYKERSFGQKLRRNTSTRNTSIEPQHVINSNFKQEKDYNNSSQLADLSHLPKKLVDFIKDPANKELLMEFYINNN